MEVVNLTEVLVQSNIAYLAISVTILLAFGVAFSFFNLNPLRKKLDKQEESINKLNEDTRALVDQIRDEVDSSIDSFSHENDKKLLKSFSGQEKKLSLETENKIAEAEKLLLEKIESVSESKNIKLKEVILSETKNKINEAEKAINIETNKFKAEFSRLDERLFDYPRHTQCA
ncbi:hypothetical protein KKH39_00350 [Patescibacteria group bacterium]|nr:hypothetical protein [Patescibacteria group bacterium]